MFCVKHHSEEGCSDVGECKDERKFLHRCCLCLSTANHKAYKCKSQAQGKAFFCGNPPCQANAVTPIKADCLDNWLQGYDPFKREYSVQVFQNGFRIGYSGTPDSKIHENHASALTI